MKACLSSVALTVGALPGITYAHAADGAGHWWSLDPLVVIPMALTGLIYLRGTLLTWRRAGVGRGVRRWQLASFVAGWAALFIALIWPLDALAAASFAAHMSQHMLLIAVAPPLFMLARPLPVLVRAVPAFAVVVRRLGRSAWRYLAAPPVAFVLHGIAIWAWHAPGAYEAALRSDAIHLLEHASFLGTALLFWWSVTATGRHARDFGAGALWTLGTLLHSGLLGALLTFAPAPLYTEYQDGVVFSLTALQDQQLAGLIMWVPGGFIYLFAGLVLMALWLQQAQRTTEALSKKVNAGGEGRGSMVIPHFNRDQK